MRYTATVLASLMSVAPVCAEPLDHYLPGGVDYDAAVPEPAAVIGHEVGEWHVTHDKLAHYMRTVAERSGRVVVTETGRTWEDRPLQLLAISSPANIARLDEIRARHMALQDPRRASQVADDMPVVVWLGYSVHGNEPSGANASMVVAYHLAAAQDEWTLDLLDKAVILIDPAINPDGLNRFATWVNMHRGRTPVSDTQNRELNERWPSGRTNHYWFDLNRDWLLLVHPESRARVREFHRWRPNVLTDHHEMGTDSTFFFQPGVPSRMNPLIPQRNFELTFEIGRYHARALDRAGQMYYTRESYDDFYLGKGSTYPDVQGTIGILFEQASSRGHLQDSDHGELAFPHTIRNQVLTSFSTLRAALDMRIDLLRYQREFNETAYTQGRRDGTRGWIFGDDGDPARARDFIGVLLLHGIEVHPLARDMEVGGHMYSAGAAWVVPTAQPQYLLARAVFETRTEFEDDTFYDVSSWTLPLAYGLPHAELRRQFSERIIGARMDAVPESPAPAMPGTDPAPAYLFDWGGFHAARALHGLLDAGVVARATTTPLSIETHDGTRRFGRGAVMVPAGIQALPGARVRELLEAAARGDGVRVYAASTGLAGDGIDLGSPSFKPLSTPRVALVVGQGVDTYEAGEAWHLLDVRFRMPVTQLDTASFGRDELDRYSHLVMVDGRYGEDIAGKVDAWVRAGGVLVAIKGAARWAGEHGLADVVFERPPGVEDAEGRRDYAEYTPDREDQLLRGAIFRGDVDTTHPLGWGIPRRELPVFRDSTLFMEPSANRYRTVVRFDDQPLLSGYISAQNLAMLSGSASVIVERRGEGVVVLMADNPNFRGYWLGTSRVFMNAIMFGGLVERTRAPADRVGQ